jgi:hypothetical protein
MQTDRELTGGGTRSIPEAGRWTSENLETEGVVYCEQTSCFLVDKEHPIIHMLQQNMHFLSYDTIINEKSLVDNRYYRLSGTAFRVSCLAIRKYLFHGEE